MSLSDIKRKYRQILEEDESACSSQEEKFDTLYQKMQKKKQQIISSANKENVKPVKVHSEDSEKEIIVLRQKLASTIEELGRYADELRLAKERSSQISEQKRLLERQLEQVKNEAAEKARTIAHKETAVILEQEKTKAVAQELAEAKFNMEMIKSQEEFYKTEQSKLKAIIEEREQEIKQLKKLKSKAAVHIHENQRLKDDIRRLTTLLAQDTRFKTLVREGGSDFGFSYLGKPHEEPKNWYPRQLIEDTELFLKSQSVGYGNKCFTAELVKHIQCQIHFATKRIQSNLSKRHESKLRETRRRLNHSLNYHEVQAMSRLKFSRVSNSRTRYMPKYTEPLFQKSITCNSKVTIDKSSINFRTTANNERLATCIQLVGEFKQGLLQLTEKQPISHKKIGRLCEWLVDSLQQVFRSRKSTLKTSILEV